MLTPLSPGQLSRRRLMGGLGAMSAIPLIASCGSAPDKAAPRPKISTAPTPDVRSSATPSPGPEVQRTDFPIEALGISWTGSQRGVQVRFYDKSGAPEEWQRVRAGCPCGADTEEPARRTHPVSRALARGNGGYAYEVQTESDVQLLKVVAIDPGASPSLSPDGPSASAGPSDNSATAEPGSDLAFPPKDLVSRSGWGADESKRFGPDGEESSPPRFAPAQVLTVHHTVTANDDPDPAATVRSIYELHTTGNDWGDIGYHFLVDLQGRVYEGRSSGADGVPAHNDRGEVVTASHTLNGNTGNIGVALLGDFTSEQPSPQMLGSLTRLLASLAKKHGLDPAGAVTYRNFTDPGGRSMRGVNGHRDWLATECPGTQTYRSLDKVRADIAALLG